MVSLFNVASCGGVFTQLACNSANTANSSFTYTSLTVGNSYYIIVDGFLNNVGTFNLCLTSPVQPANDLPCNAFSLPTPNFCSPVNAYTTMGASPETNAQVGTCFDLTGPVNGVWFKFQATATSASVTITGGNAGGLARPQVAILTPAGGVCGAASFATVACAQAAIGKSLLQ